MPIAAGVAGIACCCLQLYQRLVECESRAALNLSGTRGRSHCLPPRPLLPLPLALALALPLPLPLLVSLSNTPAGILHLLHRRALEGRAATILEVAQPGPAELSNRWNGEARARAAAAVEAALDNSEALLSSAQQRQNQQRQQPGSSSSSSGSSAAEGGR